MLDQLKEHLPIRIVRLYMTDGDFAPQLKLLRAKLFSRELLNARELARRFDLIGTYVVCGIKTCDVGYTYIEAELQPVASRVALHVTR